MEVAGFVVSVLPLLSLCFETLSRVRDYKDYKASSVQLNARFELAKTRLKRWASTVGVADGKLIDPHHPLLDQEVERDVELILKCLHEYFGSIEEAEVTVAQRHRQVEQAPSGWKPIQRNNSNLGRLRKPSRAGNNALFWAAGQKATFTQQVETFELLVEKLYEVVPLYNTEHAIKSATAAVERVHVKLEELLALINQVHQGSLHRKKKEMHEWLDAPSVDQDFEQHVDVRLPGTCDWLIKNDAYMTWETDDFPEGKTKLFWLCAPPGHGKTVLSAMLIEHLKSSTTSLVAYFFSSPHVQSGSSSHTIIRSWIAQLMRADDDVSELVYSQVIASKAPKSTKAGLWKLFREILLTFDSCTLILDGYDEFARLGETRKHFLQQLKEQIVGTKTRVFVSSRPEDDIEAELLFPNVNSGLSFSGHRITLTDLEADIALYARSTVATQLPKKDLTFQEELADTMVSKCDGMFLWIKLQKGQLRDGKTKKGLREVVERMPNGLVQSYDRTWEDIMAKPDDDRRRAVEILRWTCFAIRPLTVEEMTEALIHEYGTHDSCQDDMPDEIDDGYINGEIKGLCGSLIEVRKDAESEDEEMPASRIVHLVHISAKEFLVSKLPVPLPIAIKTPEASEHAIHHMHLAEVCLRYINCDASWGIDMIDSNNDQSPFQNRFMKHAARSWWEHWKEAKMMSEEYKCLTLRLFAPDNWHFGKWSRNDWYYQYEWIDRKHEAGLNARLYLAVLYGLPHVVDHLRECGQLDFSPTTFLDGSALSVAVQKPGMLFDNLLSWGADINVKCGRYGSALGAAVMAGSLDRARMLLDRGADPKIRDWNYMTVLTLACMRNDLSMMQLLLDHTVDLSDCDNLRGSPLFWCIIWGNLGGVKLLLDHGADMLQRTAAGMAPLHQAARSGQPEITKSLLKRKADLVSLVEDSRPFWYPIHNAAISGSVETIQVLLDYGADLQHSTRYGVTPLHSACRGNDVVEVVKFLLDNGADIMCKTDDFETPLHVAASNGLPMITKLLLERGANILVEFGTEHGYCQPIHFATRSGNIETLQVLLEQGADVNIAATDNWETPLHTACSETNIEVIRFLVNQGADLSAQCIEGYTPWHHACRTGDTEIVKFFLENNHDLWLNSKHGRTPLHSACASGNVQVVSIVLERGGNIFQKADHGWTPLHMACSYGSKEVVAFLIERGANIMEPENEKGSTPLHLACCNETEDIIEIVQLLFEKGADMTQQAQHGYTILHAACSNRNRLASKIVSLLLSKGADLSQPTHTGVTPLHLAALSGNLNTIQILLEGAAQFPERAGPAADLYDIMHFAVVSNKCDIVQFFIEKGASISTKARWNYTPMDLAVRHGNDLIMEKLIDAGADLVIPIRLGMTLMEYIENVGFRHEKISKWRAKLKFQVSPDDRDMWIRQEISDVAQDTLLVEQYPHRNDWSSFTCLARRFWKLGAKHDFIFASQQKVCARNKIRQFVHGVKCDNCDQFPVVGERWVCFTCPISDPGGGVDFCGPCKAQLPNIEKGKRPICANHDFVLVPCYDGDDIKKEDERAKDPEVRKWLESVVTRYRVDGPMPPFVPIDVGEQNDRETEKRIDS